ncbi:MAG: KOW domain-containing RNA-binding protein [Ruminococcus sp.]|nr:KOW domain-containing RNA-binding protein [Ruminococcus sp.]
MYNIRVGSVVRALAGREKDRCFVAAAVDGGFVYLADGKERKLSRPKKKSMKHISPVGAYIVTEGLTDRKLRGLLRGYNDRGKEEVRCQTENE